MSLFKFSRLILPLLTIVCLNGKAQSGVNQKKQDKYAQLKNLIDSKKYSFHALSATSMKGRTVQLTTEYLLKLNNDSLSVDLPYFGRSFTTDYPPTDLSIRFNSKKLDYLVGSSKKGGWEITIKPKNEPKANSIDMSITASGYCTVQVTSNSREPISFYGTITPYDAQ